MTSIAPRPTFRIASSQDLYRQALAMPFSPARELLESAQQGVLASPGLGTAIRGAITPSGNEPGYDPLNPLTNPIINPIGAVLSIPSDVRNAGEQIGRLITGTQNPPLSKDAYEAGPYFRKEIPWDQGMTEDRAASLATQFDIAQARAFMSDKYGWNGPFGLRMPGLPSFAGQFIGGALDPVNYVPVFGEWARSAAIGRWGLQGLAKIGAETGINAAEAAANVTLFGAMTAQQRAQYGDDVSWQAQINNAAMGALFGAVVTPALHGLVHSYSAGRDTVARIRQTVENVPITRASRDVLNDAVVGAATKGEVALTPASAATLDNLARDVTSKAEASQALSRETAHLADVRAEPGKMVITPSGARVEVRPEVVDLSTLTRAEGALQVRDRSRAASDAQISEIATQLDPARLMPSIEADRGAPIVGPDGVVDSGNGRVAALTQVYDTPAYADQAAAYRKQIEDAGYDTTGIQNPVLIQRRTTPLSDTARAQFNAEANTSATARMSSTETAAMDRGALDDQTLRQFDGGEVTSASNRPFVARFMSNLPANERAALVDSGGHLNADGQRRIENALVAAAYGDVDAGVLRRFSEATDDNTRSVVGAMADVAGRWTLMRRAMDRGEIDPGLDSTVELTNALSSLGRWREQARLEQRPVGIVIKEGMGQLDILDGEMSLEAKTFVRMFYKTDDFIRSAGREVIAGRLSRLVDAVEAEGRPSLFGDAEAMTKLGVIEHAVNDEPADLFAPADAGKGYDGVSEGRESNAGGGNRRNAAQGAESGAGGRGSITDRMTERFVAAGRPADEARAVGALVDEFYRTQAARLGIPVETLESRFGLPEVNAGGAADVPGALLQSAAPGSPEFKAWFGDSKVVDAEGKPLVVYKAHYADAEHPQGFFTDDPAVAARFAAEFGKMDRDGELGVATTPAYVSLRRPYVIDAKGRTAGNIQFDDAEMHGGAADEYHAAIDNPKYDGVIIRGTSDEGTLYITKRPQQVKSSIGNRGTFDPADPRLLFQPAYHGTPLDGLGGKSLKAVSDGLLGDAKAIADYLESDALGAKGSGNIDVPLSVLSHVAAVTALDDNIRGRVVGSLPVVVVDFLAREKLTPEDFFRDPAVLKDFAAANPDATISLGRDVADGFARTLRVAADAATKRAGELVSDVRGLAGKRRPATDAGKGDAGASHGETLSLSNGWRNGARGAIKLGDAGSVMSLFSAADASTAVHEASHYFLHMLKSMADHEGAPLEMRQDMDSLREWWASNADAVATDSPAEGVTADDVTAVLRDGTSGDKVKDLAIDVGLQEQWARGFEAYLREGNAPTSRLAGVFEQFKNWLTSIYKRASDLNVKLSPEVRDVFKRMLSTDQSKLHMAGQEARNVANVPKTDVSAPRPEPKPEGLDAAEARVGAGEDMKALAEQHGVDEAGNFPEQQDIDMLREQGVLSPEDEADLALADQNFKNAKAFGEALMTAARCAFGSL